MAGYTEIAILKLYTLPVVKEWPAEMVTGEPAFWPSMTFTVFCGETVQPINGRLR
jgi:hypothetical protein